jgi:hypothetical protein
LGKSEQDGAQRLLQSEETKRFELGEEDRRAGARGDQAREQTKRLKAGMQAYINNAAQEGIIHRLENPSKVRLDMT